MNALLAPVLHIEVHEDGTLFICSPWYQSVVFANSFLAVADGRRVEVRGDEVTFRCTNGGATYALESTEVLGLRRGSLLRSWA